LEPREVTVEGDDLRAVLERERGEVGVVDEIRSRPDAAEQPTQKAQVARARVDDDRGGLVEPELDDAGRLVERERSRERAGPRAQPQEGEQHDPLPLFALIALQ